MFRKILSLTLSISLLFQYSGFAQSINLVDYLSQGHNVVALDRFRPLALRYFSYEPSVDNFRILLDKGDQKDLSDIKIKNEADRLLTYFKIGLTLPNEKFWVNLRPDAADQIIDPELEKTDLGKVLLESDLQLKKDTSSLTSPQSKEGKAYWDKLYKKAGELFGTENITIPTITRPWIVPGEIILRESGDSAGAKGISQGAYIYKANLKVMLEEDYLSRGGFEPAPTSAFSDPRLKELNSYSTQLIRELILPRLTQKVNSSKDYANLRQVYFSLILARWFKETFNSQPTANSSENNDSYIKLIDSNNLTNLISKQAWDKTTYFNAYQKSFKEGEYNLSEPIYTPTGQVIRRYMSGGLGLNKFIIHNNPVDSKVGLYTTPEENIVSSAIEGNPDKVVFTGDEIGTQEQATSSPLQKRRLEEVIPIIEKILSEITLKKINEKRMSSRYTFEIKKIEENTEIGGTWKPTKDNSVAEDLNVWSSRGHELAGLNHHSLAGPYVKIDYILYVIPGKTTGVDLIKAVSLIIEYEGMSDEIKKDFEKAIKNTTGFSLSSPINPGKYTGEGNIVSSAMVDKGKVLLNDKLDIQEPNVKAPTELTSQKTAASAVVVGRRVESINAGERVEKDNRIMAIEDRLTAASAITQEKTTSSAVEKLVYFFGNNKTEAEDMFNLKLSERKDVLGGKGESVHSMTRMTYGGVRVPPGFTITTEACKYYYKNNKQWPAQLQALVDENLKKIEENLKRKFGDEQEMPLFVSVRSGAKFSMPGMMDTVLNVGSNDKIIEIVAKVTNDPRFAWDSYRRFIQMFGATVFGISKKEFEAVLDKKKTQYKAAEDKDLTAEALKELVAEYKDVVKKVTGREIPQDVREQLRLAISAVFESWNNERAIAYRNAEGIPHDLGTAVTVQSMVSGNRNNRSGTGVGFTRNPNTGENVSFGEFLINAQGEDVVAGIRTPEKLEKLKDHSELAGIYEQLIDITTNLEKHYKDMLDFEFTIEDGILYLLQARAGKRTATAAVKIAVDLVKEGIITKKEALWRIKPESLDEILFPYLSPEEEARLSPKDILAVGLPAGPGAGTGQIVFHADQIDSYEKVIIVKKETSPEDVEVMRNKKTKAIVTATGGMTSHAAVVGRGMGKVVMVGAGRITVDEKNSVAYIKNEKGEVVETLHAGDWVTVSVSEDKGGRLIKGKKEIVQPTTISPEVKEFISWAKEVSHLRVRVNGDTPQDAKLAKELGAEGIGLVRTEHMFFALDRLPKMQDMILNLNDKTKIQDALDKLLPMQIKDFTALFKTMDGLPVTIRTLDPPLHEFLPKREMVQEAMLKLSKQLNEAGGVDSKLLDELNEKMRILKLIDFLHELNPMLGTRGARLGILMPAITKMQARAIAEAAVTVIQEGGKANVEIMIPLIGTKAEFVHQKTIVDETIKEVIKEKGVTFTYKIGTMIEVPRAALTADEIAEEAEFFSFGTNDLTQMTLGLSRDDTGPLISLYRELGIYHADPFEKLDQKGVGKLVTMAVNDGRRVKPDLKTGACGEHGGNPDSIVFFHKAGLDYVSVSPYRILGAWLAAAQAQLKEPAPLTMHKLKTILEKMQSDNYSLSLKNKPELGRKIEVSQVVIAKNKPALVIEFGDKVTVQDIMGYISMRPEAQQIRNFFEVKNILKAVEEAGMSLPSSSSAMMSEDLTGQTSGQATKKVVGGIDFRQMNMLIQPQGSFVSSSLDFSLPALSRSEIEAFDLDKELELIQRMASSGIDPIDERFKKYLAVCFARGKVGKEIDELKLCLEDVFTAQQLDARETPDGYKEVIVIADTRRFVLKESRLAASSGERINLN